MSDLMTLKEAAEILGVDVLFLVHIIDVGDVLPTPVLPTRPLPGGKVYLNYRKVELTREDIERFRTQVSRRRFVNFKAEYADVYQEDDGPGARGLEFEPGWTGILREFCDGLREFQVAGYRARLRWAKEKFGALRLFTDCDDEIAAYVGERRGIAYGRSLQTCQECGESARLRFGYSTCLTLCDRHKHLVGEPDPSRDGIILDLNAWMRGQRE